MLSGPSWITRAARLLRSARGAFDLPSIIAGVVVVGILTAGVLAAVFGVIPWAQDNAAKQDLSAVRTAEGVARTKDGKFLTSEGLSAAQYLSKSTTLAVGTDAGGTCYVAVAKAPSRTYFVTDAKSDPAELKTDTVTGCLTGAELQALLDAIKGAAATITPPAPSAPVVAAPKPAITGWGNAYFGQMGNALAAGTGLQLTPADAVFTAAPTTVHNVSAGRNFSCAAADDKAYCWGENSLGGTGLGAANGTTTSPTAVGGILTGKKVTAVSASTQTGCAIADTAYCWGSLPGIRLSCRCQHRCRGGRTHRTPSSMRHRPRWRRCVSGCLRRR